MFCFKTYLYYELKDNNKPIIISKFTSKIVQITFALRKDHVKCVSFQSIIKSNINAFKT